MDNIPAEIHTEIFSLACTDDGSTARSLAQVCHYFHAVATLPPPVARHLRAGPAQGLLTLLESFDPSKPRPAIHHLFLSDRQRSLACQDWYRHVRERSDDGEAVFHRLDSDAARFAALLPRILAHAAPTLRTLTVLAYDPYRSASAIQSIIKQPFPHLTDLTLRGSAWEVDPPEPVIPRMPDFFEDGVEVEVESAPAPPPLFPKLARVHLAATRVFRRILRQIREGTVDGAGVSHVRFSGLSRDGAFAQRLHAELYALGLAPAAVPNLRRRRTVAPELVCVAPDAIEWSRILPCDGALQKLVVQPHQLPPATDCACCSGYFVTEEMTHLLRELALRKEKDEERYVYVPPREEGEVYAYAEARKDWESRIAGGEGCWAAPPPLEDVEECWEPGEQPWDAMYSGF